MSRNRTLAWIAAVAIAAGALLYGAIDEGPPATNADRAYSLAKGFACPVCSGQSVAESDAVVARQIRRQIAVWVDEGRSDSYIRDQLVAVHGEDIDYAPAAGGITSLVWILPVVGGVAAAAGLVVVFKGWREEAELEASEADVALVEKARARDRR
ncbi:MAG: cytochrome c-type biogenesis protein CcmH [Acidimicrobiales bacterium]